MVRKRIDQSELSRHLNAESGSSEPEKSSRTVPAVATGPQDARNLNNQLSKALDYNKELLKDKERAEAELNKAREEIQTMQHNASISANAGDGDAKTLLPVLEGIGKPGDNVQLIDIKSIRHGQGFNRFSSNYDVRQSDKFKGLVDSIKKDQAGFFLILVRPVGNKEYEIVWGYRRFEGLKAAGKKHALAVVTDVDDIKAYEMRVMENRYEKPSALEQAITLFEGVRDYCQDNVDEYITRFGGSRGYVWELYRIGKYLQNNILNGFKESELVNLSHRDGLKLVKSYEADNRLFKQRCKLLVTEGQHLSTKQKVAFISSEGKKAAKKSGFAKRQLLDPSTKKPFATVAESANGYTVKIAKDVPAAYIKRALASLEAEWKGFPGKGK